ncbi:MarR family winged helix-turn-helix transcriptional regulator [Alicyclobacillus suci]|uniref:MarR family winged helix-turn-helix transcriptional regulator n=1 Tax=Alicyclobacillus suci TaxID=2816080 RepID=UPI001A8FFC1A|nr:MarR family transcriptional regulator [Alicyclobacillus suci]
MLPDSFDLLTERFEKSLRELMQNLGPQLINRAQLGLTPGQFVMLYVIHQEGQCSVSKLAEKMEVAPSGITAMVDRMEKSGLVHRIRDTLDRRVVNIALTVAGQEKLNQVLHVRQQIVQHCLRQLDPDDFAAFVCTLESLSSIANATNIGEFAGSLVKGSLVKER